MILLLGIYLHFSFFAKNEENFKTFAIKWAAFRTDTVHCESGKKLLQNLQQNTNSGKNRVVNVNHFGNAYLLLKCLFM